jgi:recombinational DNA repair protein (RecF pathway)
VFDQCTNCSNPFSNQWKTIYFSSRNNGLLCPDCEAAFVEKKRLSSATAAVLSNLQKLRDINERVAQEIEDLFVYHFTELLGKPPRCTMP